MQSVLETIIGINSQKITARNQRKEKKNLGNHQILKRDIARHLRDNLKLPPLDLKPNFHPQINLKSIQYQHYSLSGSWTWSYRCKSWCQVLNQSQLRLESSRLKTQAFWGRRKGKLITFVIILLNSFFITM